MVVLYQLRRFVEIKFLISFNIKRILMIYKIEIQKYFVCTILYFKYALSINN